MASDKRRDVLDERAQTLLRVLVDKYIREGQPVGSRTLSRDSGLDLSPATIRNIMSDLEELGYILEGTMELTVDGQPPKTLRAGDVIFMPAGAIHNAKNIGKTTLKVVGTYVLEVGKDRKSVV